LKIQRTFGSIALWKVRLREKEIVDKKLRILILEDSPADAELEKHELRKAGLVFTSKVVDTKEAFLKELDEFLPHLILSDYELPSFDGLAALRIAKDKCPDVPLILVTGKLGEEFAIEKLKAGATDYVLKNNLKRLVPVINRALEEATLMTERKRAEESLKKSENKFRNLFNNASDAIAIHDMKGHFFEVNDTICNRLGYSREELLHMTPLDIDTEENANIFKERLNMLKKQGYLTFETAHVSRDGKVIPVEVYSRIIDYEGNQTVLSVARDITERKQAEALLKLNESRIEALLKLNHMPDASFKEVSDFVLEEAIRLTGSKIGYLAFMNNDETVLTMYSWSKSALEECRIADKPLIYPVETTGLWGEAVRQRKPVITNDYTAANPWKKGYPKDHVEVIRHMNVPVFDGDQIVIVAGVGNKLSGYDAADVRQLTLLMEGMWRIIQRKLTKETLRKERDKAQKYLDIAGVILVAIDAEQKVTLINKKGSDILGYSEQEIIGKNWFDSFVSKQHRDRVKTAFVKLMAGEVEPVEYFENSVLTKSGAEKIIAWHNIVLKDESGNIVGTLSSGDDMTERRKAQEEMKFLASIVKNIPDAVCSIDLNGNVVSWNEGAEEMLGYKAEEILGRPFTITIPNELAQKELDHCIRTLNTEGFFTGYETSRLARDGTIIPIEMTAVALKDKEQHVTNYTSIMRNISKRKAAQEEIKKRVKELEEFYDIAVGREIRMKELKEAMEEMKKEIESLKEELEKSKKQ
jgi:PAS domain S-box-containing protein